MLGSLRIGGSASATRRAVVVSMTKQQQGRNQGVGRQQRVGLVQLGRAMSAMVNNSTEIGTTTHRQAVVGSHHHHYHHQSAMSTIASESNSTQTLSSAPSILFGDLALSCGNNQEDDDDGG